MTETTAPHRAPVGGPGVVELTRTFPAPPERVFAAWADVDLLRQWCRPGPETLVSQCELDAREGGGYDVVFGDPPAGDDYREVAVYEVFEAPRRLVMHLSVDGGGLAERSRATLLFEAVPEGTRLHVRDEGLSSQELADGHTQGWTACLELVEQAILAA
jgi:uncharacterized protein YndB with AHSA1/START domain